MICRSGKFAVFFSAGASLIATADMSRLRPSKAWRRPSILKQKVVVGTHHKTGTVWFHDIFAEIARRFELRFRVDDAHEGVPTGPWDIFQETHSQFDTSNLGDFRGLHVIRDPRDVIVSAAFYHQKSQESWLHERQDCYGGKTYQEMINSCASLDDKIVFEMENASRHIIEAMQAFDYADPRFMTLKFEEMSVDYRLERFERAFEFLGFSPDSIGWCLTVAYRNSLFSGAASAGQTKAGHVRSGKSKQWPEFFKRKHRRRFERLFGDVLGTLGYEEDWEAASQADNAREGG